MAKTRWTRETALEYLANNPEFTPAKPLESYSTSELKRKASVYQNAEQEGRTATTAEARGHQRYKHYSAHANLLDRWVVTKPKKREISQQDLLDAYNAAKKGAHKTDDDEVIIHITGVVQYIPVRGSIPANGVQTLAFWSDMESLKESIDVMYDIFDFAGDISHGLEWETVDVVDFAFPNEK